MKTYKLIAFDMDGTLLNSNKAILPETRKAIYQAASFGKTVCLATGRALDEILPYRDQLSDIRYAILLSGGLIYDLQENSILSRTTLSAKETEQILSAAKDKDCLVQLLSDGHVYLSRRDYENLAHFHMSSYRELFSKTSTIVEDTRTLAMLGNLSFEKINLDFADPADRDSARNILSATSLMLADAEVSNLECNPPGISKGRGLEILGKHLGIETDEMIAVGDADNDRLMLSSVGCSIAMGNASDDLKRSCYAVVADNDHDGCAEAIYRFLLHDKRR